MERAGGEGGQKAGLLLPENLVRSLLHHTSNGIPPCKLCLQRCGVKTKVSVVKLPCRQLITSKSMNRNYGIYYCFSGLSEIQQFLRVS